MVVKELIAELEKAQGRFDWMLSDSGGPMAERRATPRLRLRARLKDSEETALFDPIGVVCFSRTGLMFSEDYWVEAAMSLNLPLEDARDIMATSNDMTWRTVENRREPDPYKQALRQCLLNATRVQSELSVSR